MSTSIPHSPIRKLHTSFFTKTKNLQWREAGVIGWRGHHRFGLCYRSRTPSHTLCMPPGTWALYSGRLRHTMQHVQAVTPLLTAQEAPLLPCRANPLPWSPMFPTHPDNSVQVPGWQA